MTPRYHTPHTHGTCPVCKGQMEMGQRVMVQLSWELGRRDVRVSRTTLIDGECAELIAHGVGLGVPKEVGA